MVKAILPDGAVNGGRWRVGVMAFAEHACTLGQAKMVVSSARCPSHECGVPVVADGHSLLAVNPRHAKLVQELKGRGANLVVLSQKTALEKLQNTELEMLRVFKEWCSEKGITWFVDSGTCLGAMRHRGFIPWDDDVDVGVPREDYDQLLVLAKEDFPEGYSLHTSADSGYTSLFAKMYKDETIFSNDLTMAAGGSQGIYIDIFPYDYLSSEAKLRARQERKCANLQRLMYLHYLADVQVPHNGLLGSLEKLLCSVGHFFIRPFSDPARIQESFDREAKSGNKESAVMECLPFAGYVPAIEEEILLPVSYLEFEGLKVPAPRDPERYLRVMYGDWTVLPPDGERHTHLPKRIVFSDGVEWNSIL